MLLLLLLLFLSLCAALEFAHRINAPLRFLANDAIVSPNRLFRAVVNNVGVLQVLDSVNASAPVAFATQTQTTLGDLVFAQLQGDGNFVIYAQRRAGSPLSVLFSTGTPGNAGAFMQMQDDRNLVLYDAASRPLWQSGTSLGRSLPPAPTATAAPAVVCGAAAAVGASPAERLCLAPRRSLPFDALSLDQAGSACSPTTVTLFDATLLNSLSVSNADNYEQSLALGALAGIVNRERPRLYVLRHPSDFDWLTHVRAGWLANATFVYHNGSVASLIRAMLPKVEVTLYGISAQAAASAMVAASLAGVRDTIPVAKRDEAGSLFRELAPLVVNTDLTTVCVSKTSCYDWALTNVVPQTSPYFAGYYLDYHWVLLGGVAPTTDADQKMTHTASNIDFFVSKRSFIFDLSPIDDEAPSDAPTQPVAADPNFIRQIMVALNELQPDNRRELVHVGGFVPWAFKYSSHGMRSRYGPVESEWLYAALLSQFNAVMDADACCIGGVNNAAFFQHDRLLPSFHQKTSPRRARAYDAHVDGAGAVLPKKYFAIYAGDFDAAAWVNTQLPRLFADPARGDIPISWGIASTIAERMPTAFKRFYDGATPNDVFIGAESPGYFNPDGVVFGEALGLPSRVSIVQRSGAGKYALVDHSFTGYAINGNYGTDLSQQAQEMLVPFSWDGVAVNGMTGGAFLRSNTPFIPGTSLPAEDSPDFATHVRQLTWKTADATQFAVLRFVLWAPSDLKRIVQRIKQLEPNSELVDAYTLGYLARKHLGGNNANRVRYVGDTVESLHELLPGTQQLSVTFVNDAIGQTIDDAGYFLLVQLLDDTLAESVLAFASVPIVEAAAEKGGRGRAAGAFDIPANLVGKSVTLHYEIAFKVAPHLPFSVLGSPARAIRFPVRAKRSACSSAPQTSTSVRSLAGTPTSTPNGANPTTSTPNGANPGVTPTTEQLVVSVTTSTGARMFGTLGASSLCALIAAMLT
jgi:hypothetical protein